MAAGSTSEATYKRAQAELRRVLTRVVAAHSSGRTPELVCPRGQAIGAAAVRHGPGSPQHQDLVELAVDELLLGGLALELLTAMLGFARGEVEADRARVALPIADELEPEKRPESVELVPAGAAAPGKPSPITADNAAKSHNKSAAAPAKQAHRSPPLPAGISPSSRPTAPPPAGYQKSTHGGVLGGGISGDRHIEADDGLEPDFEGEATPTVPLDDYPQVEMSEVDFSDADTSPQTPRAKLGAAGKTIPSWPAPPPIPELLSKQLRDRKRKP